MTGLSENIVSGNMEFLVKESVPNSGNSNDHEENDLITQFNNYIISLDPLHYLRKGNPMSSSLPNFPGSWMEQWPLGKESQFSVMYSPHFASC